MDRRVIFAVAGSGKTSFLVSQMDSKRRYLVVTYTNNNTNHLRQSIIDKFGYYPNNIKLYTYFEFLLQFCYSPFYKDKVGAKGIFWEQLPESARYSKIDTKSYYLTASNLLYHNRISALCRKKASEIKKRIEKYYDCFYIDEVQDVAGHDFNFVLDIIPDNRDVLFVGDFYQHTFNTSLDGKVNKTLFADFNKYKRKWSPTGLSIDTSSFAKSYRCSPSVCQYVRDNIGIDIYSNRADTTEIRYVSMQDEAKLIIQNQIIPKFFLRESWKYACKSINWGDSKGMNDFSDICIVLNKETLALYNRGKLNALKAQTRNKLYVAMTRARGNIYLLPYYFLSAYKTR